MLFDELPLEIQEQFRKNQKTAEEAEKPKVKAMMDKLKDDMNKSVGIFKPHVCDGDCEICSSWSTCLHAKKD